MKLISIIIPTFNRADLLPDTLDSILEQTYTNWECILVDDGSTDESKKVIENYIEKDTRFKYYDRPDHLPKSGNSCRNYGFEISNGEYINFFDSDDIMLPNFLESRICEFRDNIKMVIATYSTVNKNLKQRKEKQFIEKDYLLKDYILWRLPILTHSIMFKKEVLVNKELFNPRIKRGQETYFFLSVLKNIKNDEYLLIKTPSFLYRLHENTISSKANTYNNEFSLSLISIRVKAYNTGIELYDKEIVENSHLHLIVLLFKSINAGDFKSIKHFIKLYVINNSNFKALQKVELIIFPFILCVVRKTPKKLEKRWIRFLK